MKLLYVAVACLSLTLIRVESNHDCKSDSNTDVKGIEECKETEYQSYVECVRRRMKRDTGCQESNCQQCDCDFCAVNACESQCESCCADNPPCKNRRCCHKTCHSRCKTIPCRTDCRRNCAEKVATITHENVETNLTAEPEKTRHNVTTIIDIHNIINNTNEIQIPIQINNTNFNNFTLENTSQTQETHKPEIPEQCCQIISPRQCVPKSEYPYVKCFHLRKKACGNFCQAPTLYEQTREVCEQTENGTNCREELVYLPQSQQRPLCSFQPAWPYISCPMPQQYYGYGMPPLQLPPPVPTNWCPGGVCYNNMYGLNPYYQPTSFYDQSYPPMLPGYGAYYQNGMVYPNNVETAKTASASNESSTYVNKKEISQTEQQYQYQYLYQQQQPLPPWPPYYPVQITPLGYPYQPPMPVYYLPPEVNIQATVSHPEKDSRYAQITITDKSETDPNNDENSINPLSA